MTGGGDGAKETYLEYLLVSYDGPHVHHAVLLDVVLVLVLAAVEHILTYFIVR